MINRDKTNGVPNKLKQLIVILPFVAACCACGQKGPLKLPEPSTPANKIVSQ